MSERGGDWCDKSHKTTDTSGLKTWVVTGPNGESVEVPASDKSEAMVKANENLHRFTVYGLMVEAGYTAYEKPEMVEVRKEDLREVLQRGVFEWGTQKDSIDRLLKAAGLEG